MVPSPRKRAQLTSSTGFNQTWDHSDAAYFDPNTLPLAKIPRGWERKQDVKSLGKGREKKIWRRFDLRSRAADPAEEDEEEHDARSRAVKKLQRMSPKAMEKTTAGPNGKKRAFKATRWDRRKSVLPRKKAALIDDSLLEDEEVQEKNDSVQSETDEDNSTLTEATHPDDQTLETDQSMLPANKDRRSTFTFTMDTPEGDDVSELQSVNNMEEADHDIELTPADEATLIKFFQSPVKEVSADSVELSGEVEYPQLPGSDDHEMQNNLDFTPSANTENDPVVLEEDVVQSIASEEPAISVDAHEEGNAFEDVSVEDDNNETPQSPLNLSVSSADIAYPSLPTEAFETATSQTMAADSEEKSEDAEMLEAPLDVELAEIHVITDADGETSPAPLEEEQSDEEFAEASLQLNVQHDYDDEQAVPQQESDQEGELSADTHKEQEIVDAGTLDIEDMSTVEAPEIIGHPEGLQTASSPEKIDEAVQPLPVVENTAQNNRVDDIAEGLTLSFAPTETASADPTPRKLHSPPPPARLPSGPDDVTMTIAIDDDTALLKDFLSRAAASKAEKAAMSTHRRESLQNRRDSDVIRHALASPRKVLEDKDPNSPSKHNNELTMDLSQTLTLPLPNDALASTAPEQADLEGAAEEKSFSGSRRSSRTKKSRLPAPASTAPTAQAQASKIAIRRADGNDVIVLKKSDAQGLAAVTRANTRKNKQGAFGVTVRLLKLAADAASLPPIDDSTKELVVGKNVRWDEQLAYYQENPETAVNALADTESLTTPDELSLPGDCSSTNARPKSKVSKNSTPKIRRVRGLGTANGTPGKGLLTPASLLPEAVQVEKEANEASTQQLPRPKTSKTKKMPVASTSIELTPVSTASDPKLSTLEVAPVGVQPSTQRKSRLAAPKKVMLPTAISAVTAEGKENVQRPGIGDATPRKGIPAPKVMVPPTVGVDSGLPRRRGRKY